VRIFQIDRVRNITPENFIEHVDFLNQHNGQQYSELNLHADTFYQKPNGSGYFGRIVTQFNILGLFEIENSGEYHLSEIGQLINNHNYLAIHYLEYFLLKFQFPRPHFTESTITSNPFLVILKLLLDLNSINSREAYLTKNEFYELFKEDVQSFPITKVDSTLINKILSNSRSWGANLPHPPEPGNDLAYDRALLNNSELLTINNGKYSWASDFYIGLEQDVEKIRFAKYLINKYANLVFTYDFTPAGNERQIIKNKWSQFVGNKKDFFYYLNEKCMLQHRDAFISYCNAKGFYFTEDLIRRFLTSLLAKPYLLLTGISGTGKSKIAELFGEFLVSIDSGRLLVKAVGSNWNDRKELLGYWNPLVENGGKYFDTDVVRFIKEANENPAKLYVLLLDEMNLSYTERYFSDFLSALESLSKEITLPDQSPKQNIVNWSDNFKVIGTINEDETTHTLSLKVLDRANVIEMYGQKPKEYFDKLFANNDTKILQLKNKNWSAVYISLLEEIFIASNKRFGLRTIDEITKYILINTDLSGESFLNYFDEQVYQKILPKIHGTKDDIRQSLNDLQEILAREGMNLSTDKCAKMSTQLQSSGFTSFVTAC
jgi:MoxR-like ATPase